MQLPELLEQIDQDLQGKKLISPEIWINRSFFLSGFLEEEQIREAEYEIKVAAIVEMITMGQMKDGKVNMTQAENRAKKEPEYLEWRKQKARVQKIENYISAAKKHSSRLY